MIRRLLQTMAATLAATLIFVGLGQPAHAGSGYPPCGPVCDGKDPAAYKPATSPSWFCSADATTVGAVQYGTWRAEMRYSNRCETTWARLIDLVNGSLLPNDVRHISRNANGTVRKQVRNGFVSYGNWTTMLNDSGLYNSVCLDVYADEWDYADGIVEWSGCTASY